MEKAVRWCGECVGDDGLVLLLLLLLVVHQAGTVAALGELHAILVAQLVDLPHELLYLLHDGLILLLILLLVGSLLLRLLVAGREVRCLLLLWLLRLLVPRVRDLVGIDVATTAGLLCLACGLFQFSLEFFK